jgi:hypothetical protein
MTAVEFIIDQLNKSIGLTKFVDGVMKNIKMKY